MVAIAGTLGLSTCLAQTPEPKVLKVMGFQLTFVRYREGWAYTLKELERRNPGVKIEEIATAFVQTLKRIMVATLGGNAPITVALQLAIQGADTATELAQAEREARLAVSRR